MATLRHPFRFLLLLLLLSATKSFNVKWTPENRDTDPTTRAAHDAPRSQKYWDEHDIQRPEYGKTDAEIAADKRRGNSSQPGGDGDGDGGSAGNKFWICLVLSVPILYVWITGKPAGGNRLGGGGRDGIGVFWRRIRSRVEGASKVSRSDERDKRLARFEGAGNGRTGERKDAGGRETEGVSSGPPNREARRPSRSDVKAAVATEVETHEKEEGIDEDGDDGGVEGPERMEASVTAKLEESSCSDTKANTVTEDKRIEKDRVINENHLSNANSEVNPWK